MNCPFLEDVNEVGDAEVAIFGAPLDSGTTYRPGARFGPQGIRRSTNLFGTYCYELGVDLREQLNMVDIGDVFTIPGNLEKSFDQISQAMAHVVPARRLPGRAGRRPLDRLPDHPRASRRTSTATSASSTSIGTSTPRRPTSTSGCTPRRGSTPPTSRTPRATNLVQIGIGGWQAPRAGVKVGRERGTTIMTVGDVERVGIEKIAETALEIAWKGAKAVYLSFDIDVIDAGFVPGTGWPEPGGLLPREALNLVRLISAPGLAGHGGGRVLAAVRLGRADRAAELPGDLGLARRAGPRGTSGQEGGGQGPTGLGSAGLTRFLAGGCSPGAPCAGAGPRAGGQGRERAECGRDDAP